MFDCAYQINPYDVVAQNAGANLIAKSGRIDEAIGKYQDIIKQHGKNDPYTLCGLGFLLLKRDKDKQDIVEARQLFEKAQKIPGSEDLASLGLWVAHARLGNKNEILQFKKVFEEKRSEYLSGSTHAAIEPEETEFNKIKDKIAAENMADPAIYNTFMKIIFVYVHSVLMKKQIHAQIYRSKFKVS